MNNDLITVIVPVFNIEKYLPKCIDSILNQTYKNIEVLLINDGSTDSSGLICEDYKKTDSRIVVIHKENEGLSCARNSGLDIAKGNYICFVDGDDYIEKTMIEELKINMEKFNSDISICDLVHESRFIKRKKKKNRKIEFVSIGKEKFENIINDFDYLIVPAWNKLYKKNMFDNLRYPKGKIFEDSFILCNLLDRANKISFVLKPMYNYVNRKDSITHSFGVNHFDKVDAIDKIICILNNKGYYDLEQEEKNRKMNCLIINLSKMKRYDIINKKIWDKYYQELIDTNKEVKWKGATKYNKFYKVLRKSSISILAFMLKVRDKVKR